MEIIIQDTYSLYNKLMGLPEEKRQEFFEGEFMEPFHEMFKIMHMPIKPESIGGLSIVGKDVEMRTMLLKLKENDAWKKAEDAINKAVERFKDANVSMPEKVVLGVFLGNPDMLSHNGGITGFGGIPGYIQVVITPDERSLDLLPSIVVHEFHHNVLFNNAKWNFMNVSVAKYLALEGLAESFAESLYGYEYLGPWVKDLKDEELEKARKVVGKALDVTGFNEVRRYIFGDGLMAYENAEPTGIPPYSGYAAGYHAVQAYLKKTGKTVEEATLIDGEIIMKESGYFE